MKFQQFDKGRNEPNTKADSEQKTKAKFAGPGVEFLVPCSFVSELLKKSQHFSTTNVCVCVCVCVCVWTRIASTRNRTVQHHSRHSVAPFWPLVSCPSGQSTHTPLAASGLYCGATHGVQVGYVPLWPGAHTAAIKIKPRFGDIDTMGKG